MTVFGESAGAGVISALLAMDQASGLFRRAVAQSVPGTVFSPGLAADITDAIAAAAGVAPSFEALSQTDPMRLVEAQQSVAARMREFPRWGAVRLSDTPFSPVVDGEVLPRAPWRALLSGVARDVELLTGHNRDEYRLFIAMSGRAGNITEADAATVLDAFAPARTGPPGTGRRTPARTPGGCSSWCSPTGCSGCRRCTWRRRTPPQAAGPSSTNCARRRPAAGECSAPATRWTCRWCSAIPGRSGWR